MGDSAAAQPPPVAAAPSFSYLAVFGNCPLVAAVLAFAIAQSIKVFTTWYKENRWDAKQLVGSGGMPSSHSATVTALAVAVGLQEGFSSSLFATAAIFASVLMKQVEGRTVASMRKSSLLVFTLVKGWHHNCTAGQLLGSLLKPTAVSCALTPTPPVPYFALWYHRRIVMYDAFGVRLHAGKQAEVLNQIVYELPSEHPLAETRPLRELIGHTPPQVFAGGVLGFAVATFTGMMAGLGNSGWFS